MAGEHQKFNSNVSFLPFIPTLKTSSWLEKFLKMISSNCQGAKSSSVGFWAILRVLAVAEVFGVQQRVI